MWQWHVLLWKNLSTLTVVQLLRKSLFEEIFIVYPNFALQLAFLQQELRLDIYIYIFVSPFLSLYHWIKTCQL